MRTLGRGKAEKDAAWGALQWRRGEGPNAALRLSPTFAADNDQRTKPHAASATINARAKPHATARRMLSKSPYQASTNTWMRRFSYREPASKATSAEISVETNLARGAAWKRLAAAVRRSPKRDLADRRSGACSTERPCFTCP